jgi:glycosyltransferase involved in cell wall biosynthesis
MRPARPLATLDRQRNFALRRARLGESFTDPERVYRVCKARGMDLVTISDHNTLEGALRIAHLPDTFMSVEVTTQFPDEQVPLHVLVWDLTEEDHRDLQPYRSSVFELVALLRERRLAHALAHPLYRMGAVLTVAHVERLLLLFSVWEGRNGARSHESNELACGIAAAATPEVLDRLANRYGLDPAACGGPALTGGSDDHGALDIATTWTESAGSTANEMLAAVMAGECSLAGEHGSTTKLAHALTALLANGYRAGGGVLPDLLAARVERLFDEDAADPVERHREITEAMVDLSCVLGERGRAGGLQLSSLSGLGGRLMAFAFSAALQTPYLATAQHHADSRHSLQAIEQGFFGLSVREHDPRALVFTDTFVDVNGVAGTMRQLAAASADGRFEGHVVVAGSTDASGVASVRADWIAPIPDYDALSLSFPVPTDVLARVEQYRPDVVHVATPGPVGLCGLAVARLLGIPVVGSYHTELGPYALHLTHDVLVSQATGAYVDWFYRQCGLVLAPTASVAERLRNGGLENVHIWGRGVDATRFDPALRDDELRSTLLDGADILLLSVGRLSREKRLDDLFQAYARVTRVRPHTRLVVVGDGPERLSLQRTAPTGVTFVGEARGDELSRLYASADLFCFTSTTDTFGQVLLEAAASGLPVVAVAAGGAVDLVEHGATGRLVPVGDSGAFAAALLDLAEAPLLRGRYASAARRRAAGQSWDGSLCELTEAYRLICRTDRRRLTAAA